jgi:diaminohydroxyphosphoribosylaminopyrimidine deaminase/5-amino-6-(5-phosphoribosylamino)uracil reductase
LNWTADDYRYMARAIYLARKGINTSHPNPRVGCVLVKDGRIIGEGSHIQTGKEHAEINAIKQAGAEAAGATCYVTLEPCVHTGNTPPCTTGLINAGIKKVIASIVDPNPVVNGKGLEVLEQNGITTYNGLLSRQAEEINNGYIKRRKTDLPYVICKMAISVDAKTALSSGKSQWITGEQARMDVQRLRAESSAIVTGIGTVLADNPRLTVRDINTQGRSPLRVVIDRKLRTPHDAELFKHHGKVIIFTTVSEYDKKKYSSQSTVDIISINNDDNFLLRVMKTLASDYQVNNVLLESGAKLAGAMLDANLIDEFIIYQAPVLLGHNALPMMEVDNIINMQDKYEFKLKNCRSVGDDLRLTYLVQK